MANGSTPTEYDWLAMLYLGGDNDLFHFGQNLIEEAKRVGSSNRVAVVAEHDPADPDADTFRGQLLPGRWESESIGPTTSNASTIIDFIENYKREFPAKKRLLVLWDHGNGWQNVHVFQSVVAATNRLRLNDIVQVVDNRRGIDVLCFDSCLMAMIEIAYQLREKVKYVIASENVVPADSGWPYDAILRMLTIRPDISPEEIAIAIVNNFSGAYNGSNEPITLSALRLANVEDTVSAIDDLARELIAACTNESACHRIFVARRYSQSFGNPDYIDLVSFCNELQKQQLGAATYDAADEVKRQVSRLVISTTHGTAPSISDAHGLSIYFPDRPMSPLYMELDFAKTKTCLWATFIAMMTPKTVSPRPMRSPQPMQANP